MNDIVRERIIKLQDKLQKLELDAAVIMDRENLIYFAQIEDIEASSLIVPATGEPVFVCLWLDAKHITEISGIVFLSSFV